MLELNEWERKFEKILTTTLGDDASHDLAHSKRVYNLSKKFSDDSSDLFVLMGASYFHDIVNYPKNDKRRSLASKHSALKAKEILEELGFYAEKIEKVMHCIEAHSFSAGILPKTIEAKILQDADRMEALGAIGIARTFYVSGMLQTKLFSSDDPFAENRELDDKSYALDHFFVKLFKLPETMQTNAGKAEAKKRVAVLQNFLDDLKKEL